MNEERLKVLKMLKEGRITMEEAELLLDALSGSHGDSGFEVGEGGGAARNESFGRAGETSYEKETQGSGRSSSSGRRPGAGGFFSGFRGSPGDLFNFDWKLDPTTFQSGFREAMKGFEQSMKELANEFKNKDFAGGFKDFFGRSSGQSTKSIRILTSGVEKVAINNRWGDMRITGADTDEITGTATITSWGPDPESAADTAGSVEVSHYRQEDTLVIRCEIPQTYEGGRFRVDLDLTLPTSLALAVKAMSGDLSVSSVQAGVRAVNLSGDIIVQQTTGAMSLESKSGDIGIIDCSGEVGVHTVSGDIDLDELHSTMVQAHTVSGDVDAKLRPGEGAKIALRSTSGDIRVELPSDLGMNIEADTASGEVHCELQMEYTTKSARKIAGMRGDGGSKVSAQSRSGDVTIR